MQKTYRFKATVVAEQDADFKNAEEIRDIIVEGIESLGGHFKKIKVVEKVRARRSKNGAGI